MESIYVSIPHTTQFIRPLVAETSAYYYGEGQYNTSTYNGQVQNSGGISELINTGTVTGLTIAVGAVLIFTAIIVKIWRKPKKEPSNPENS